MNLTHITVIAVALHLAKRLRVDSRVVIGQICRNRLFLQAFHGGRDRCGIFEKSLVILSVYVLYRVYKTLESNMRPVFIT